ncbi:MAG TPA: ATP-binding protein, partial [Thermoanaerobaculia bacterium]|nr:ATP-binding protein [Thermoanaerobaculia bacterium]
MSVWDSIAGDAARTVGAPVAFVGVLDHDGEKLLGAVGTKSASVTADASFASRIRGARDLVVITDATADSRLASHPLVTGAPAIRFYAGVPLLDEHGEFLGALSVIDRNPQDRNPRALTPQQLDTLRILGRHAARELVLQRTAQDAEERFREFFEHTSDLVMTVGANGALLHANDTALSTLGVTRGTALHAVVDPERRDEMREVVAAVFASNEPQRIETLFITAAGRRITVEGWLRPKVIDGRAVLARVVFRDVTDRKQFEADLGNARDAALEAARLKSQFLTNVSHEIRTPMNGIIGMIDLLVASPLTTEQLDHAHQARASAEQLLAIVNNILYVSSLEAGRLSKALVDFDLYRTLERIVEVMKIVALGKELDVRLVYDKHLPPVFRGPQSKIRVVVTNLLENAIKFTDEGSVVLSVAQQTETDTHHVIRFEVCDTGIGIADEDRLLLFERFSQVEATSTRRFGGVGLGLATARQLVETMGGLIDVDSEPGKGSAFWFTVPLPKHAHDRRPIVSSDLELKGKRVLLLDQQPTSRKVVRHYLEVTWE